MSNWVAPLKQEISRLARKEIRAGTVKLCRATAQHRRDLAVLKQLVSAHAKQLEFLGQQERKRVARVEVPPELAEKARFSPKWLATHRGKLALSAADYGRLIGVSGQSIYHWEQGKTKPRRQQVAALAAIRKMRRREALRRIEMLCATADAGAPGKSRR